MMAVCKVDSQVKSVADPQLHACGNGDKCVHVLVVLMGAIYQTQP